VNKKKKPNNTKNSNKDIGFINIHIKIILNYSKLDTDWSLRLESLKKLQYLIESG
jgi:hypothetical protein